ncbi:E3 ubiquitin protein ligase SIRP1-like protein [Tanacetum coccineum]
MLNISRLPQSRQSALEQDNNQEDRRDSERGESELSNPQLDLLRMRRGTAAIFNHLLQGNNQATVTSNPEEGGGENNDEHVTLINPFNQTIIVHRGARGGNPPNTTSLSQNQPFGSFGDCFLGPDLEQLLERLAENDPNRYETPPAKKDAVQAMPSVTIEL